MRDIERAKAYLTGEVTLALVKGDIVITKCSRGVAPLVELYDTGEDFSHFSSADKVVGRGAAHIYVALGIRNIYASVISESALSLLRSRAVAVEYGTLVKRIMNRRADGNCPIEECVMEIDDTEAAIAAIRARLLELNS